MSARKKTINLRELYEEKRGYPRVTVDALVTIRKDDDTKLSGVLHDISPDGVQLIVDGKNAKSLNPSGRQISQQTQFEVRLNFFLPIGELNKEIKVHVKLYYFSIIDSDVVAFGGKFTNFIDMTDRHVNKYIENSVIPIENKVVKLLNNPMTSDDLREQIDDDNIDLDDTLNLLKKKKEIVSYQDKKQEKFVNLESAISTVLSRLDKIESRVENIEKVIKKAQRKTNTTKQ